MAASSPFINVCTPLLHSHIRISCKTMALAFFSRNWVAPVFGLFSHYTSRRTVSSPHHDSNVTTPFLQFQQHQRLDPETQELWRVFSTFDENGDGKLSKEEMSQLLEKLGLTMSDTELSYVFDGVDSNSDGFVDFSEFIAVYQSVSGGKWEHEPCQIAAEKEDADLMEAFQIFDKNGDGYITAQELQSVLCSLGFKKGRKLVECKNMIMNVDRDGDGRVDFKEFKEMMATGFQSN